MHFHRLRLLTIFHQKGRSTDSCPSSSTYKQSAARGIVNDDQKSNFQSTDNDHSKTSDDDETDCDYQIYDDNQNTDDEGAHDNDASDNDTLDRRPTITSFQSK